ncbi:TetR/AcrR family transcriptional regulator [Hymenobacter crusticola]|uniref:HTH tetR-type domain-containing protein n=1 Tax=Hymenobacter crusticola TaxID=1770526 RepID=A0A243W749_9BACT|nr:TetR/AcrR family transcriptional regulator [Hymenobacter crusticola]OUJ68714.1 hypothetical protein BXP70_27485 [Hymenobacter crusticola]
MPAQAKPTSEVLILDAAQAVFLERGLTGARMQEIADRAGINKAMLHYYFRSKEKLFEVVVSRAIGGAMPQLFELLESEADLFAKIYQVSSFYLDFISRNTFLPLFIVDGINRNPQFFFASVVQTNQPRLQRFFQQVEEAVAAGRIRPISGLQLLINIVSLIVFPFLAKPLYQVAAGFSEEAFAAEMARRRAEVPDLVINGLQLGI